MNPSIVSNLRILEDGLLAAILIFVAVRLFLAAGRLRKAPYGQLPLALALGLLPFLVWKLAGVTRRVALANEAPLSLPLERAGEVFEVLSGIALALAFFFVWRLFRRYSY